MEDKFAVIRNAERFVVAHQYDRAIGEYQKLLETFGEDPSVLNTMGDLLLRRGRKEEAVACFHRVADIFSQSGFSNKAVALYRKIAQLDPDDPGTLRTLADHYLRRGLRFEAARHLRELLQLQIRQGDRDGALGTLQELLSESGEEPELLRHWADLTAEGDPQEAAGRYARAARMFADRNQADEARACAAAALSLNPAQALAKAVADQLEEPTVEPAVETVPPQMTEPAEATSEPVTEVEWHQEGTTSAGPAAASAEEEVDWDSLLQPLAPVDGEVSLEVSPAASEESSAPGLTALVQSDALAAEPEPAETAEPEMSEGWHDWQDFGLIQPSETVAVAPEAELSVHPELPAEAAPVPETEDLQEPSGEVLPEADREPTPVTEEAVAETWAESSSEADAEEGEAAVETPVEEPSPAELTAEAPAPEAAAPPGTSELDDLLDEVDFCLKLNLRDDAERLLTQIARTYPDHPKVLERAQKLGIALGAEAVVPEVEGEVSLAAEIDGVLEDLFFEPEPQTGSGVPKPEEAAPPVEPSEIDIARSQFDLGLAYREMGMFDDAAAKFEEAYQLFVSNQETASARQCCQMLCSTLMQAGDFQRAVEWADIGLSLPGSRAGEWRRLEYDRALALENLGEIEESLAGYRRILDDDPHYLDVRARVAALDSPSK
jgi:tetratricopeptide (TPR) repeat protein